MDNWRKALERCAFVCAALAAAFALLADDAPPSLTDVENLAPQPYYSNIARKLANMLPAYHVTQKSLGGEISQRAWTNLVTMYDYNHAVFLKSDLDAFEDMKENIGASLRKGDLSFAYDLHKVFVRRLNECVTFVTNLLETTEFDFTVDETCQFKRKDAPWPETVEERNDLWRRLIKNELLAQTLVRELDAEEEAEAKRTGKKKRRNRRKNKSTTTANTTTNAVEGASSTTNSAASVAAPAKPELTPKEILLNKYRHYLAWVLTELDEEKIMERYLLAVTMAYDPHSGYMAPLSKEDFDNEMSLSLFGVGAVLSQSLDDGALEIKEIMKGGPLAREGSIKEGDKIVGVGQGDGPVEDIVWKSMRKSIRKIRGPKNTKVVLEVTDKNGASRRKVPLIRDVIKLEDQAATGRVERVTLDGVERTMGYVRLPAFYGTMDKKPNQPGYRSCSLDVAKWISKFNTQGTDGMILDLRGNGGGSLREAVMLTALFVRPNPGPCPVVQIRETRNLYVLPTFPDQPTFAYRKPLVVLIDRHSASASEIVAGALQDTGRAVIVGDTQSHGKGTVQTVLPMGRQEYGSMKITTARFYRINGSSTQVKGVASDICQPSSIDERTDVGEDKLPNALPWTRIEPASFEQIWNMPNLVPRLRDRSAARTADSPEWKRRREVVKLFHDLSERKAVTIARDARKKLMKDDRAVLEAADEADFDDDEEYEKLTDAEKEKEDAAAARKRDIVLTEAFNILADVAAMTDGGEAPPPPPPPANRLPAWLQAIQRGGEP
ncbi:MAG: carboxy terminal-processing peptidase [Kiritimatiellae bacterium]|nr:carboxy terminal-processing peptidase [Kiritimatiellia bacterium]